MHTPGEDGVGLGTGLIPPQMPAALLGIPQYREELDYKWWYLVSKRNVLWRATYGRCEKARRRFGACSQRVRELRA
jgi:hypothetical protein